MPSTVEVRLSAQERGYGIRIESGLLKNIGTAIKPLLKASSKTLLLSDANVAKLYAEPVAKSLKDAGYEAHVYEIAVGENSKSLSQAQQIYDFLSTHLFSRTDAIVALGGGVVGDLGGFCAATWHRGMQLIQVPTSLIAQVDSAVGGKTAVNLPDIKNAVGVFYQPLIVLADPDALRTLPASEVRGGMAEVFKYALIETSCAEQSGFFEWLDANSGNLPDVYEEMIARCVAIKAAVVNRDELDTLGLRAFLNLGHTFAHAYESLSDYRISHGDAVALGTLDAVGYAERAGMLDAEDAQKIRTLHKKLGLPQQPNENFSAQSIVACMRQDKKNDAGKIKLVLPDGPIGKVCQRGENAEADLIAFLSS